MRFVSALRHPKGGSFVRLAKVSFGVDYPTVVQRMHQINMEEVLHVGSSKRLEWRLKEHRYDRRRVSSHCAT